MTHRTNPTPGTPSANADWLPIFVLLAAIWGSSFLFMRVASVEFGAWPMAATRVAIAALALWPLLWLQGLIPVFRQHAARVLWVGVLNSGIPFACFGFAVQHLSTGLTSILNATVPLFGAIVAWLWLGDRPDRSRITGLILGFMGVGLLVRQAMVSPQSDAADPMTGWAVAACLLATLCYALAASYTRRNLTGVPPLVTATGSQVGATLGLALPAALTWPAHSPGLMAWGAVAVVGIACTAVAYVLYFRLIATAGPARTLTVTFVVPLFAIVYGVMLLGETLRGDMLAGGVVVIVGTALSTGLLRLPRRKTRP
jgi:drug/metabolite transporter (DMT)-like permease